MTAPVATPRVGASRQLRRGVAWLRERVRPRAVPFVGRVRFGSLRRLEPIDREFGFSRGTPVDRYYIEAFLARYAIDIRGRVLEVGDARYTRRFGGARVTRSDVLHVISGNPEATIVADLSRGDHLPSGAFDCIVLTQTLQCIYDQRAALQTCHRILKPGGVLLATTHGISKLSRTDMAQWGEYWRLTSRSARLLFEETFAPESVQVETHGNVLTTTAFLYGLAAEELTREELEFRDPKAEYEMLITIRVVKAGAGTIR